MLGVVRIAFGTLFLVRTTLLGRPLRLPGLSDGVPFFGWPPPAGRFPLATMLHLGAVIPNLSYAADAHYHHLVDDVIVGGRMQYVDGAIAVPKGPGLGVTLDREKLRRYAELYKELGPYPYDQDPARPGWTPLVPNDRWADPSDDRVVYLKGHGVVYTVTLPAPPVVGVVVGGLVLVPLPMIPVPSGEVTLDPSGSAL